MRIDAMGRGGLAAAVALLSSTTNLDAQEWSLTAQTGRIRSALDPAQATAQSFAAGLRYDDPTASLRLSAGVPTNAVDALWAGLGGWKRWSAKAGAVVAGVDLAGSAFLTADRTRQDAGPLPGPLGPPLAPYADRSGSALAGQAMPVLGLEGARVQLHARAGLSRYAARFGGERSDRTVRVADAQLTLAPTASVALVPVVRRFEPRHERAATYAGVTALAASRRVSVWGGVGRWSAGIGEGTPWSAGGRLQLNSLVSLDGTVRRDTYDPLYLQPPQTSWSVGLMVRLGRRRPDLAPPVPAAYVDGRASIRLPVSASRARPSIAGDFTDWKPVPMERSGAHWTYTVALAPGVYHYAFVSPTGEWFVPESVAGRRDDGMGGHVAVLVVR